MTRELEQAAQDAIRFLDELPADLGRGSWNGFRVQIAHALRAALAAPQGEPVAWRFQSAVGGWAYNSQPPLGIKYPAYPLYASPQPQQTEPSQDTPLQHEYEVTANDDGTFSVGLPDGEELRIIPPQRPAAPQGEWVMVPRELLSRAMQHAPFMGETYREIRDALAPPAAPQPTPTCPHIRSSGPADRATHWCALAATPPEQRRPLTDEQIDRITDQQWATNNHKPVYAAHRAYARAVEQAHDIGGEK